MKYVRVEYDGEISYGVLKENGVQLLAGDIFGQASLTDTLLPLEKVRLLAPCVPSKAVCVGLNYRDHAEEMNIPLPEVPVLFLKPSTALANPGDELELPAISNHLDYECELAVVIGRTAKNVPLDQATDYIFGYTCGNDVTARDLQTPTNQWTSAKGFDKALPLGPCIVTDIDAGNLEISTIVNGQMKQHSNTRNLIFKPLQLVSYISSIMTLLPGDVIMTGTPSGISRLDSGDTVTISIEGIGELTNPVK